MRKTDNKNGPCGHCGRGGLPAWRRLGSIGELKTSGRIARCHGPYYD